MSSTYYSSEEEGSPKSRSTPQSERRRRKEPQNGGIFDDVSRSADSGHRSRSNGKHKSRKERNGKYARGSPPPRGDNGAEMEAWRENGKHKGKVREHSKHTTRSGEENGDISRQQEEAKAKPDWNDNASEHSYSSASTTSTLSRAVSQSTASSWTSINGVGSKLVKFVDTQELMSYLEGIEDMSEARSELLNLQVEAGFARVVLDSITNAVLTYHIDLGILDVNQCFENMFRMTKNFVRGKDIKILMPEKLRGVHDGYIKRYMQRWRHLSEAPPSQTVNAKEPMVTRAVRRGVNGEDVEFKASIAIHPLSNVAGMEDTSEPSKVFVAVIQSLEEASSFREDASVYRNVFTNSLVGQIMVNTQGQILAGNKVLGRMFGINVEDWVENKYNIKYLMPDEVSRAHDGHLRRYRRDHAADRESKIIGKERAEYGKRSTPDGKGIIFPIKLTVWRLDENTLAGNILDATKYVTDQEAQQNILNATLPRRLAWSNNASLEEPEVLSGAVLLLDQKGYTSWVNSNRNDFDKLHMHHKQTYMALDQIAEKYKLDVVDHEGDSVLAFSTGRNACKRAVYAAIEMVEWAEKSSVEAMDSGELVDADAGAMLGARIGIAYGEVVSGVYGSQRRFWKVGGFPVVMAARLESSAPMNHIQICRETRNQLSRVERECFERMERNDLKGIKVDDDGEVRGMTMAEELEEAQGEASITVTMEDVEADEEEEEDEGDERDGDEDGVDTEAEEEDEKDVKGKGKEKFKDKRLEMPKSAMRKSTSAGSDDQTMNRQVSFDKLKAKFASVRQQGYVTTYMSTPSLFVKVRERMALEAENVAREKQDEENEHRRKVDLQSGR